MSRTVANLGLLLAAAIWGAAFIFQKAGVGSLGAASFTGIRFLLGALVVFPLAWRSLKTAKLDPLAWIGMIALGAILFVGSVLQQVGILLTSAANAGFLTTLYVPLVPLFEMILLRRPPHPVVWPSAAMCLGGAFLLSGATFSPAIGDVWVILSSGFWTAQIMLIGALAKKTEAPLVVVTIQFLVCGVLSTVWGVVTEAPTMADVASAWSAIAYTGIVSAGCAFTLQAICQRYTSGAIAAVMVSAEAPFAALFGAIALGEMMSGQQLGGCLLILSAILLVQIGPALRLGRAAPARE